jgi:uncharacterized protein (TIRG00374 family)
MKRAGRMPWLPWVVTAILVVVLVASLDWTEVLQTLRQVRAWPVVAVLLLVCVERVVLNIKWQALLAEGKVRVGFLRLLRIQFAANAIGTFLPSSLGVDALRVAGLWSVASQRAVVLAATLLDRLSMVAATLLVAGVMLMVGTGTLAGVEARGGVVLALFALLVLAALFWSAPGRRAWLWGLARLPAMVRERIAEAGAAAKAIGQGRRAMIVAAATTLAAIALRILIGKLLLLAAGVDVPLEILALVLPAIWVATMLPISVGGIGVQDAAYVVLLAQAGVPAPVALAASLLDHVLSRAPIAIGLLFWKDVVPGLTPGEGNIGRGERI